MELYDFQREDVEKLHQQPSALILNDLGTGKTVESVARDLKLRDSRPWPREFARTLIVTKLAVIEHWVQHYRELAPSLRVSSILQPREQFLDGLRSADIVILHWQALRRPPRNSSVAKRTTWHQRDLVPILYELKWLHVIADEAHNAKNRKAQQTWVLKHIPTQYKTAVTGTPVTNKPPDLWSLLNWCDKKEYSSYWKFFERYVEYEVVPPMNYKVPIGVKNVAELQRSIEPFTVRRKKQEVLPELPPSYETTVRVDLDPKQRRAYNSMRDHMVAWLGSEEDRLLTASVVIAKLLRLQQLAIAHASFDDGVVNLVEPSSKLDAIEEILEEAEGEQFVIFSQFRGAIQLLERRLAGKESYSVLTGHTKPDERRPAIDNFQASRVRLFLCTIGAGGEGIDLFAASKCIFIDRSWTPTANDQAIGRLHRNGQVNAVQVMNIEARKTIDQYKTRQLTIKAKWLREMLEGI
jgi:SNF2 family DNA or RNA helicase